MKFVNLFILFFIGALSLISCSKKEKKENPAFLKSFKWKATNPVEELGYNLYFDKRLSVDDTVSCNTCHNITFKRGGVDGFKTSTGVDALVGERNAPTVWNAKFLSVQFWDGRAKDLVGQAKESITNPVKMGMESHEITIEKIEKITGYQNLFKKAYPESKAPITIDNLAKAIAAFESTLVTLNSTYDKHKAGAKNVLTHLQKRGLENFKALGCVTCHSGDHLAGPSLPIGQGFYRKFPTFPNDELEVKYSFSKDLGRYEETKKDADKNMWRVPTLRNIALTAPYFHNGEVETLEEVVKVMAKTQLDKDITPSQQKSLVAFLEALTGDLPEVTEPSPVE